jgi:hypothetical protein
MPANSRSIAKFSTHTNTALGGNEGERKVANWQRHLKLGPEFRLARDGALPIWELARVTAARLKALAPIDDNLDAEREELVFDFECIASDRDDASREEFDDLMGRLYDWADTPLDHAWNGKKCCWIDTHSSGEVVAA